jgi:hypothetical protein
LLAVAEHKVDLPGGTAASQCDVWAVIKTTVGLLSLTVEAKAREAFGDEILERWLIAGKTKLSAKNRKDRWDYIRTYLPDSDSLPRVRYQMLHRCAASVIEARRLGCPHAAFVVQAFDTPDESFRDYQLFCEALKIPASRGGMGATTAAEVALSVGWVDCPFADDAAVAACA